MTSLGVLVASRGRVDEAEEWYRRAAEAGSPEAMNNLGAVVERRDAGAAEEWYRRAAGVGQPAAMTNLAGLLAGRGEIEEAAAWYRRAAGAGEPHAIDALAAEARRRTARPQVGAAAGLGGGPERPLGPRDRLLSSRDAAAPQ
jgi:Flp pilus assembly protein TadD